MWSRPSEPAADGSCTSGSWPTLFLVPTLEEITYNAGRDALADQEALVGGIRQRTGTLLAAHALVASFLGGTAVHAHGLYGWTWVALGSLVLALLIAAVLLAPWKLDFAVNAGDLYRSLYPDATREAEADTLGWLAGAGFLFQNLREKNAKTVRRMSLLSAVLGGLMVLQTVAWLLELGLH